MDVTATQTAQSNERLTRLSLLLGIVIWFGHQNIIYALASLSCIWGWFPFKIAGITGLQLVETIITLIALALMLVMIYLPWRNWRRYQTEQPPENPQMLKDTEKDRRPLVAFIAMGLNCFFLLFILASFVPIFALPVCRQG